MNLQSRFLATTFLLAAVLFPTTAQAVGFTQFERMNIDAQSEFVAVMIDATEKALRDDGRPDLAAQMEHLFTTIEPGDSMSLGLVEYVRNEALARVDDDKHASEHPNDPRLEVEDALFVTLKKNGIVMSDKAMNAVDASLTNFHAETYAEFEAKSPAEQRRFIALLFRLAWPDYVFREDVQSRIKSHKGSMFSDPDQKRDMLALVNTQFPPQSTDQPGFANLAKEIEAGYTKSPDKAGPFFEITLYVLRQLDAQVVKKIDAMDAHTLLLPGGRHIYKADNGDLWAVEKGCPDMKLDEHDKELADRISECMTRRGISNGPEGLAACRDEVGIPRDSSTNPAPCTAPAAPPPSVARVPQRPRVAPIMVGKVDVSHLAGLQRGDTREYISSILGPPASGPDGDVYSRGDGISIKTNSTGDSPLDVVTATGKSSRGVADPLLDLLGKSESAAVALLGPPKARESLWDIDNTDLMWTFPMDGRSTPEYANPGSIQTLTLHYRTGVGCESINLVW